MKILDYAEHFFLHLVEWTTVIDLFEDFNYMKKVLSKGNGIERCEASDEIQCKLKNFLYLFNL